MRWTSNYWRLVAVIAAALITACSAPPEESGRTGNENSPAASSQAAPASQPANANVPEAVPQGNANSSPGATVSPLRNVPSSPPGPTPAPSSAEKPAARVAGAAPAAAATGPKLVVVSTEKELDFGKQPQDKTLTRAIRIKNGGGEQLKIESVSPSWGCTTADFTKVLRPGQAGSVTIKVETGKSPGPHLKSVTIRSNDPDDPSHLVQFKFDVKEK